MNLKKIVSVFAAASMLAAMAVNASAYKYTAATDENKVTTWDFVEGENDSEKHGTDASGIYDGGLELSEVKWQWNGTTKAEGVITSAKNKPFLSYTATEAGTLTVYANTSLKDVYIYADPKDDPVSATQLEKNVYVYSKNIETGTYVMEKANSSSMKISKVVFTPSEGTSANLTATVEVKSVVNADETSDGKAGTVFVATITNSGSASGVVESLDWKVTYGGETKTTDKLDTQLPITTLAGGEMKVALLLEGFASRSASAEVKINGVWQTVE